MDNKSDIIAKIQKLLSLANSPNEHEAKLAAERASEMLVRHNLKLSQVEGYESDNVCKNFMHGKTKRPMEHKFILSIIEQFFFVRIVQGRRLSLIDGKIHPTWSMIGDSHNVEIAMYVQEFLERTFKRLFQEYKSLNDTTERSRNSYYLGLHHGVIDQLKSVREKIQSETSLVVIPDPKLDDMIEDIFGKTSRKSVSVEVHDKAAIDQGAIDGKKIRIAKGLDTQSTNSGLLLKKSA